MVNLPRPQRGFTLLEGIIALSVLVSLLVLGSQYTQRQLEASLQQSAAAHLRRVTTAAVRYAQDHYDKLGSAEEKATWEQEEAKRQQRAQPPLPTDQTPRSLEAWRYDRFIKQGYLPTPDRENCYGQAYAFYIQIDKTSADPKKQLLILTTGGRAICAGALLEIARQIGGHAGYITKKPPDTIVGSQRGWQLPLPAETLYQAAGQSPAATPEPEQYELPGHLATVQTIDPDDLLNTDNLLHRTAQPNKPQRNRMETDLALQRHQIIFTAPETEAKLSAQGLQFTRGKQQLDLGWHPLSGKARIVLKDPQGSVVMNATRVTTTGKPTVKGYLIKGYSAPELQAYWNKVPYYELSSINDLVQAEKIRQEFANQLCLKLPAEHETALGRLFMLGHEKTATTFLYLCSHGASPAQIIAQFPPPESGAASPPASPSSSSSSRTPAQSPRVRNSSSPKKSWKY